MDNLECKSVDKLLSQYDFKVAAQYKSKGLTCTACGRLMIDAYQTFCGCKYCHQCIIGHLDGVDEYCKGGKIECREKPLVLERNATSNPALNRRISKLGVICPHEFCETIVELCEMEEHMELCAHRPRECPYSEIGCACGMTSKQNVETHLQLAIFAHSQLVVESIRELRAKFDVSLEDAGKARIKCGEDQRNGSIMKNKEMNDIRSQAERDKSEASSRETRMTEELRALEAEVDGGRRRSEALEARRSEEMRALEAEVEAEREHVVVLEAEVCRVKVEVKCVMDELKDIRDEGRIMRTRMNAEREEFRGTRDEIEVRAGMSTGMRGEMERLKEEFQRMREESIRAKGAARMVEVEGDLMLLRKEGETEKAASKKIQGEVATLRRDARRVTEINANLKTSAKMVECCAESASTTVRIDALASTGSDGEGAVGELWFTVDRMAERTEIGGECFESPHFYSHTNGYKLRIIVDPNSDYSGPYPCVSSVVCRGEYDAWLEWPCMFSISVAVVHRDTKKTYETRIIEYGRNTDNRYSKRPIDTDNPPYYPSRWVSLAAHSIIHFSGAIIDDSLLFHVIVSR